jgi:hypothetical protein
MGIAILVAGLPFIFVPLPSLISKLVGRQVQVREALFFYFLKKSLYQPSTITIS